VKDRPAGEVPTSNDLRFLVKRGVRLDTPEGRHILRQHIARFQPGVVILEHFGKLHAKAEKDEDQVKPLLDVLDDMQREYGCAFRVQKHNRKEAQGQSKRKGEMLAGSIALFGWGESSVYLTLVKKGEAILHTEAKDGDTAPAFVVRYHKGRLVYAGEASPSGKAEQNRQAVLEAITEHPGGIREELRQGLSMSDSGLRRILADLVKSGKVNGAKSEKYHDPLRYWPN
jgi:uncharacterized membrane protein